MRSALIVRFASISLALFDSNPIDDLSNVLSELSELSRTEWEMEDECQYHPVIEVVGTVGPEQADVSVPRGGRVLLPTISHLIPWLLIYLSTYVGRGSRGSSGR